MSTPKLVSVGLPVWNGENFLRESLNSLLSQTYRNIEVVISDNASTDATREICEARAREDSRIRYSRLPENIGAIRNYNRVLEKSSGEYFMWHAHDDLRDPTFIEKAVQVLDADPGVAVCFSGIRYIDSNGVRVCTSNDNFSILGATAAERLRAFIDFQRHTTDVFWAIFGLTRRMLLLKEGSFKPFVASDQALLVRLVLNGGLYCLPEYLFYRRIHAQASTVLLPRKAYRERARWYSIQSSNPIVLPNWQLLTEELGAILRGEQRLKQKALCSIFILRMFSFRLRKLIRELLSIPGQLGDNRKVVTDSPESVGQGRKLTERLLKAEIVGPGKVINTKNR